MFVLGTMNAGESTMNENPWGTMNVGVKWMKRGNG
jgi:hypothetical protein